MQLPYSTGLLAWYDASQEENYDVDDNVPTIKDFSGNNRSLADGDGDILYQPYSASPQTGLNRLPAFKILSTSSRIRVDSVFAPPCDIFIVARLNNVQPITNDWIIFEGAGDFGSFGVEYGETGLSIPTLRLKTDLAFGFSRTVDPGSALSNWHLFRLGLHPSAQGQSNRMDLSDAGVTENDVNTFDGAFTSTNLTLGGGNFASEFTEMLIFDHKLAELDRESIETYLFIKYFQEIKKPRVKFPINNQHQDAFYSHAFDVTPSDENDLPVVTRALYGGNQGDVAVIMAGDDSPVVFKNSPDAYILRLAVRRVLATGTDLVGITGLY